MEILNIQDWRISVGNKPVIIAGPCSAETEDQVLITAKSLVSKGIRIFRAGIWKPRTRPNAFEGIGSIGLQWMKRAKEETGILLATEVATPEHLEECLEAGIDIFWIGARTSANPFAMQELAEAMKGMDLPVLVKNPVNPDTDLWQGAIERLQIAGIKRIGAVHRGVSSYDPGPYRNVPLWEMPIELKRRIPDITMLCDPSHIAGNRIMIESVAQKAFDLNFDGLMIETHNDPDHAWTDAQQQINPDQLERMLQSIKLRIVHPEGISYEKLDNWRDKIDELDLQMLEILLKRMEIVHEIGRYKKANNMTILQPERWNNVLMKNIRQSEEKQLGKDLITKIFFAIHEESIRKQTEIMNKKDPG